MYYYEVLPRDPGYQPAKPLTYSYAKKIPPGQLVLIQIKNKTVVGIVVRAAQKPSFKLKEIDDDYSFLPPLPTPSIKLIDWIQGYYPSPMGAVVKQFLPKDIRETADMASPELLTPSPKGLPPLTSEQRSVLKSVDSLRSYLLQGSTGSGKTRIYIELALRAIQNNKSVLVLTPEISLTSQLSGDFKHVFGERVLVVHSMVTPKQHYSNWVRVLTSKEPLIVLGPRSAMFSPFTNLGLVIVDEAHEDAYKQDQSPHYHAVRVASVLASLHRATFLIGSATPSVADYYLAQQRKVPILTMRKTAVDKNSEEVDISVVDIADRSQNTRHPYLSNELMKDIEKALEAKEQVLLFLNRRGTARVVFCENCGWKSLCPRCDLPMIYHGDSHTMQCHTCGHTESVVNVCPVCHEDKIVFRGMGTKAIADAIQKFYPQAKVQRFDTDNKKDERFEQHYERVKSGVVDIIIGTQTVVKGLDLPKLGLVGVIVAESSLFFPDFSAGERTYQLLTQVIGRVGRGHRAGKVVIQTFDPKNPIILSAVNRDWDKFYNAEIAEREKFTFPPFCYLLKLTCKRATEKSVINTTTQFAESLAYKGLKIEILGPAPSFYEKLRGKYQWQVVVKSKDRNELLKVIDLLPSGWSFDIDPVNLL
jgi:primosomal protein N' (replication factor Y)